MQNYELLNMATDIGFHLLEQGAEIYRVEDSISRILAAYGQTNVDVYAVPGSIVVTLSDEDDRPLTRTRRILRHETNLDKVDQLNHLSRTICQTTPELSEINAEIRRILARKTYPAPVLVLAYMVIGFSFSLFFEGSLFDALVASGIAAVIRLLQFALQKLRSNEFFSIILCSAFTSTVAIFAVWFGLADNMDKVTIGALMTLVPGITLTNCMRDFIAGDFMTGLSRMVEALLTATAIAAGVAINLFLLRGYIL